MTTSSASDTPQVPLWRQIQRTNFIKWDDLADFLHFSALSRQKILPYAKFPLNLPRRLAQKIQKNTIDDPIFRQFVPLTDELVDSPGFVAEPLQDTSFRKTKKIVHKYQGRALLLSTSACAMHCRFCFRQNFPYETKADGFEEELAYIAKETTLNELILSGGDPLSLSNATLQSFFESLEKIPHIRLIRFHSRFPVGIPERIDDAFLQILKNSSKQIVFILHCNHALELDTDVLSALKKIQQLGIPTLNQSVLLKGVNDKEEALLNLSETLVQGGILPYYLHLLDLVKGAAHFLVSDERGKELIHYLQKHTAGYAVPRLVRETPGESSKSFISC
jgi:EF-P beta-lysylation protein EpmB